MILEAKKEAVEEQGGTGLKIYKKGIQQHSRI